MGKAMCATGWEEASVRFGALVDGEWQRYRFLKATPAMSHAWRTEWMRTRKVEAEPYRVDIQGMFYELQPVARLANLQKLSVRGGPSGAANSEEKTAIAALRPDSFRIAATSSSTLLGCRFGAP